jgi:CheY-like chemotaxis protein
MSLLTERYAAVSAEYAEAVTARTEATARIVATGPAIMRQIQRQLDDHAAGLRSRRTVRRSVLVLDDQKDLAHLLALALEGSLAVPVFATASIAEARMRWSLERCAVVVADYYLGPNFGDEFLIDLPREVQTVLISGMAEPEALLRTAAITGSLPRRKPCGTLVEDVREALARALPP